MQVLPPITLLTGIPRSGTTLACKILNEVNNVVALHEPIDPQRLSPQPNKACKEIFEQVKTLRKAIINGEPFEHGDKSGIDLDNPVALDYQDNKDQSEPIRQLKAQRGVTTLARQTEDMRLIVKQNALFAALAAKLSIEFKMVAIIRNPIKVLLSWMTVDLPVNKGRLPAGEKYAVDLVNRLNSNNTLEKQLTIYKWFIQQYATNGVLMLKYEDILNSQGQALYQAFDIKADSTINLSEPTRKYPTQCVNQIKDNAELIVKTLACKYYSSQAIENAIKAL
jgi:hypothetical protein